MPRQLLHMARPPFFEGLPLGGNNSKKRIISRHIFLCSSLLNTSIPQKLPL